MKIYILSILITFYINLRGQELNYISHEPNIINNDEYEEILTFGEDADGTIYAAGNSSKIYKYNNGEWNIFSIPASNKIQEITGDGNGNLYIVTQNEGLWILKNNKWNLLNSSNSIYPDSPQHGGIAWDKKTQSLWVGTDKGLIQYQNDSLYIYNHTAYPMMIDDDIKDLVLDPDGSIWMISHISTLVHLKNNKITSQPIGWNLELYNLVLDHIGIKSNGNLVFASPNYGLITYDLNKFNFIDTTVENLFLVAPDSSGNIWTANKNTLYQYSQDTVISYENSYIPLFINNIFISSDNHLWIAGENDPLTEIIPENPNSETPININEIILIYPIPVSEYGNLTIEVENPGLLKSLTVFNLENQKIYKTDNNYTQYLNLKKGIYLLSIDYNKKRYLKKIIVK